tara:strand:- start:3125 stop:3643 length:519 start_codon:yes stop_codon:yes gene_type:complete
MANSTTTLFSPSLLSSQSCPPGLILRPLSSHDYHKGHCHVLRQLTEIGNIEEVAWLDRYQALRNSVPLSYYVVVVEEVRSRRVVATATLFLEMKFIRNLGLCGHIEDVVVCDSQRGKGLGLLLIKELCHLAKLTGCYKIILDCSEKNVPFYEKCGFKKKEEQMVQYLAASKL